MKQKKTTMKSPCISFGLVHLMVIAKTHETPFFFFVLTVLVWFVLQNKPTPNPRWLYQAKRREMVNNNPIPIASGYGIFTYIHHKKSTKCREIYHTWIVWD